MLNAFIYYLFIGTMFTLIVDIASWYAEKRGMEVPTESEWDVNTRLVAILIWPIGVIYFIAGLITVLINNNNNKNNNNKNN